MVAGGPGAGGYENVYVDDRTFELADFFWPTPSRMEQVFSSVNVPVGGSYDPYSFVPVLAAGISLPNVVSFPSGQPTGDPPGEVAGDAGEITEPGELPVILVGVEGEEPIFPEGSIFAPGDIWGEPPRGGYVDYPSAPKREVDEVGWLDVFSDIGQSYVGARYAPPMGLAAGDASSVFGDATVNPPPTATVVPMNPQQQAAGCCPAPATGGPRYGRYCYATNTVTPMRRRRRRKLVTSSDLQGLAAIKAIVGGGAAMNAAVVKALR